MTTFADRFSLLATIITYSVCHSLGQFDFASVVSVPCEHRATRLRHHFNIPSIDMFPADTLISSYVEDQTAAYEARKRTDAALIDNRPIVQTLMKAPSSANTPDITRASTPAVKPAGVLGNIWQGFFRPIAPSVTPSSSASTTPTQEKGEQEAHAERMRDIDIVSGQEVGSAPRLT